MTGLHPLFLTGNPRRRIPYPFPAYGCKCADTEPVKLANTASAVEASFAGAGVQRAASPLCRGCRGGSALLGSRGNAHWQVKGGSHYRVKDEVPWRVEGQPPHRVKGETPCPGRVDACVNSYWVLPDAKFAGFTASPPLPRPRSIFAGRRKSV